MDPHSQTILIVEDDMIISMVLGKMVQKLNHTILDTVTTGREAIKVAQEHRPDLILMDIQLKDDIDGIEAMRAIREKADIPVIYITGNSDSYNQKRAKELGFVKYMVKPIRMQDLEDVITELFTNT